MQNSSNEYLTAFLSTFACGVPLGEIRTNIDISAPLEYK